MSHPLKIDLSDAAYAGLERRARAAAVSPAEIATAVLEKQFGTQPSTPDIDQAARERFERHFGEVDLGHPTDMDNEGIDAGLARAYDDPHEEG